MSAGAEGLFERFKDGDDGALHELLDGDRPRFHDYVFRMTGNEFAARETMAALVAFGLAEGRRFATLEALRAALFGEARTENRREWNAPTHKLTEIREEISSQLRSLGLDDLDRVFRSLPGPEREALILMNQNGFSPAVAASIIGVNEAEVMAWHEHAVNMVKLVVGAEQDFTSGLQRLPFACAEETSDHSTVALSQVIDSVRKAKPGLRAHSTLARLLLFAIFALAVGGSFYILAR